MIYTHSQWGSFFQNLHDSLIRKRHLTAKFSPSFRFCQRTILLSSRTVDENMKQDIRIVYTDFCALTMHCIHYTASSQFIYIGERA